MNSFNVTLIHCQDKLNLKCSDGGCYELLTSLNTTATCSFENSSSILKRIGFWKPVFPSQDFWTYVLSLGMFFSGLAILFTLFVANCASIFMNNSSLDNELFNELYNFNSFSISTFHNSSKIFIV
jgi:hypothetical protein